MAGGGRNRLQNNERRLGNLQDNIKRSNIHVTGVPEEGRKRDRGTKKVKK